MLPRTDNVPMVQND